MKEKLLSDGWFRAAGVKAERLYLLRDEIATLTFCFLMIIAFFCGKLIGKKVTN